MDETGGTMSLRAHPNVVDMAEKRLAREESADEPVRVEFIGWQTAPTDAAPAAPRGHWRAHWLRPLLGVLKRARP
jgi:hypothetical protein